MVNLVMIRGTQARRCRSSDLHILYVYINDQRFD